MTLEKKLFSLGIVLASIVCSGQRSYGQEETKESIYFNKSGDYIMYLSNEADSVEYQQLRLNYLTPRRVNVVAALDNVTESNARKIISAVSEEYTEKFNISLNPIDFIRHSPGDSLNSEIEFAEIKKKSGKEGEVYLLFTNTDWKNNTSYSKGELDSLYGESLVYNGFAWIEMCHKKKISHQTLTHEIAHLFGAEHEEDSLSIMHSSEFNNQISWSYNTWKTILSNKFKRWGSR